VAGLENGLPLLSPVDDHGKFTEEVGVPVWAGRYVFDANKDVVEHLRERGMLLGEQIYRHSYPHCWRSKTPVVFRAVEQFFIKIEAIRAKALAAIDTVNWVPAWGRNRIYGTVESRPDWCISRQRSWGVPVPVFYGVDGKPMLEPGLIRRVADLFEEHGTNLWFEKDDAWWVGALGLPAGATRRNDTLDVWIDSGVSHQAVVRKRLGVERADVYLEATDQHRGWFQSSLMTSVALRGDAPYKTCITHGFVVDKDTRKKVSKSAQGTYAKPMDAAHFVGKYGADIVRLWASSVEFTNEVPFSEESFALLADAYRQFRNVLRILLANSEGFEPRDGDAGGRTLIDRWMRSRLQEVVGTCREAYGVFDFRKVFQTLNQFCTVDLSAIYVDVTKDRLYCDGAGSARRRATQAVMREVFESVSALLAPILAFTTDEAWEYAGRAGSIHLELFPQVDASARDVEAEAEVERLMKLRGVIAQAVEPARQEKLIGNALEAAVTLRVADAGLRERMTAAQGEIEEFLILSELHIEEGDETAATLTRTNYARCERCWRHREYVGKSATHPDLCERCEGVVSEIEARA
jgi:isoleucyl-tRNA synthetase